MKKLFFLILLSGAFFCAFSQQQQCPQIVFQYDASGNRIQRKLIITNCDVERIEHQANQQIPNVNIYPNPAQDKVNIILDKGDANSETTVVLYDLSGKEITSMVTASLTIQIDVSNLSVGTYLLKITKGNKNSMYNILKN